MNYTLAEYLSFFLVTRYNKKEDGNMEFFSYNAGLLVDQIPFQQLWSLIADRFTIVGDTQFTMVQSIFPKDENGKDVDFSEIDIIEMGTRIKAHPDFPFMGDGGIPPKKDDDDDIDSVRELWN